MNAVGEGFHPGSFMQPDLIGRLQGAEPDAPRQARREQFDDRRMIVGARAVVAFFRGAGIEACDHVRCRLGHRPQWMTEEQVQHGREQLLAAQRRERGVAIAYPLRIGADMVVVAHDLPDPPRALQFFQQRPAPGIEVLAIAELFQNPGLVLG